MALNRTALMLGCCLLMTVVYAADEFPADTMFLRRAEQSGEQAIADARFALKMSKNAEVKKAAMMLRSQGIAANRRLAALAVEKGWPSPSLTKADTTLDYSDYHFISRQIRTQQRAIALYEEEAINGADTDLQEFARETLPNLQRALVSLQSLRSS
jgi:predicted outer membrane protein